MDTIDQRSARSAYWSTAAAEGHPLPSFGTAGTGGIESVDFYARRSGYVVFVVVHNLEQPHQIFAPYAELMGQIKTGFGRTMSRLPEVFGVSRQTLYNWLGGETPKLVHQRKIEQLATAAKILSVQGIKPTSDLLDRALLNGKSFLQLLAEGADGADTAERLARIARRSADSKSKLDAILMGRQPERPDISDMGLPSLKEDV